MCKLRNRGNGVFGSLQNDWGSCAPEPRGKLKSLCESHAHESMPGALDDRSTAGRHVLVPTVKDAPSPRSLLVPPLIYPLGNTSFLTNTLGIRIHFTAIGV